MAIRYLALVATASDQFEAMARQVVAQHGFTPVYMSDFLCVLVGNEDVEATTHMAGGVAVGHLFSKTAGSPHIKRIEAPEVKQGKASAGASLLNTVWGGYVSFVEPEGGAIAIMRDPSGLMPCYYVRVGDSVVIGSDIEALCEAGYVPSVNWSFLPRHLYCRDLRTPETALIGVTELLAGHCLLVKGEMTSIRPVWSPWDHAGIDQRSDADMAADLRETVLSTVKAWGNAFDRVLLSLSGGLDSSIVAACLARAKCSVNCVTLSTDEPEGDERTYAETVASGLGLPIVSAWHNSLDINIRQSASAHLPRPSQTAFTHAVNRLRFDAAEQVGATAIFEGVGGDNVFCHMRSATPLLDQIAGQGLGLGTWKTIQDICAMTGNSNWDVIKMAARRQYAGSARYAFQGHQGFLSDDALSPADLTLDHPWLEPPKGALIGKAVHVAMMARMQGSIDGFPRRGIPAVDPLLSQPIVEACLKIPTWKWVSKGEDRSIARQAFSDLIPGKLAHRRSKGTPDTAVFQMVEKHRAEMQDFLLGGLLADTGMLDLSRLETVLSPRSVLATPNHILLLALTECEAWVRHWQSLADNKRRKRPRPGVRTDGAGLARLPMAPEPRASS
ncbi:MAG: asparagine synthase-related protein [Asticcacaulis sp.]|uniref:asparagine synthase-related protein n=1 Tax=Asticcacaulis sp. TaxID=1872648 RepID=UPI0039E51201